MKRFTLKSLLLLIALVAFGLWFCFVKTECTIALPNHAVASFEKGANISIIHKTKGLKHPVFYVKNERIIDLSNHGSTCDFTFRASSLTKVKLWMQGYESLSALPGTHN